MALIIAIIAFLLKPWAEDKLKVVRGKVRKLEGQGRQGS